MSLAPGVHVTTTVARKRRRSGLVPGTVFVPMICERGPVGEAVEVYSIAEKTEIFGGAVSASIAHDALDAAFKQGAPRAFISRIVGPAALGAKIELKDSDPATVLTITAVEPGAYWNATTVAVAANGGNFVLTITEPDGTVHTSGDLADTAEAVAWVAGLEHFTATAAGSSDPVTAAATAMTSGTDDAASITEMERATALAVFDRALRFGTLIEPGTTTSAGIKRLAEHAESHNRLVLADIALGVDVAGCESAASALRDEPGMRRAKLNRSYARVGSSVVPFSALEAGMLGRNDDAGSPAGQPAAGPQHGTADKALSLVDEFTTPQRATLNDSHVNVAISTDDGIIGYGNRSLSTVEGETQFSQQRTLMILEGRAEHAGEKYVHLLTDGEGSVLSRFLGDLIAICQDMHREGSLFGASPDDAYTVDVLGVNTDETLLAGELHASIEARPAGAAEKVKINITAYADRIGG